MKVIDYSIPLDMEFEDFNGLHRLKHSIHYFVYCTEGILDITLDEGFKTDGASVPWLFQWVRKKWYNSEKDLGSITHDALYTLAGRLGNRKILTREECDDILRGTDRCTRATNRAKAGLVDKAVEFFASGKKHWGNDEFKQIEKIHIKWMENF